MNLFRHPNGTFIVVGSTVQIANNKSEPLAAVVTRIADDGAIDVQVFEPGGAKYTLSGSKHTPADAPVDFLPNTWRPLPLPVQTAVELPLAQFVDALKPVVEAAVEACVTAKFNEEAVRRQLRERSK